MSDQAWTKEMRQELYRSRLKIMHLIGYKKDKPIELLLYDGDTPKTLIFPVFKHQSADPDEKNPEKVYWSMIVAPPHEMMDCWGYSRSHLFQEINLKIFNHINGAKKENFDLLIQEYCP